MRSKNSDLYESIENYVNSYQMINGISPSIREIAVATGVSHPTVSRYLSDMQQNGTIEYDGIRNIRTRRSMLVRNSDILVPNLGQISCGSIRDAIENHDSDVPLPSCIFGSGELFMLTASGDSMINAGIDDGDYVVLKSTSVAEPGSIIAPLIDGEYSTLKRFRPLPEKNAVMLIPENDEMDPIEIDLTEHEFLIQGVVVNVIKCF